MGSLQLDEVGIRKILIPVPWKEPWDGGRKVVINVSSAPTIKRPLRK